MGMSVALISAIQWKKRSSKAMRRGRGRKRRSLVAPEIPLDLQIEILSRLPAESLMRFKCVSKLWSCLIRCRYLSNRYVTVASRPRPPPRLYVSLVEHDGCDSMEVCQNPGKSALISFSSSNSSAASFDADLTMSGMGGHNLVVLRGLILYTVCRRACIYNPATRQNVTLPAVKSNIFAQQKFEKCVLYFFGYDPVLDQYKVVCNAVLLSEDLESITSECWVLVLEAGCFWKKTEFDQPHVPTRQGLCINGVIYYMASTFTSRDIVFSFDVRSEEFNMIQAPDAVSEFGESVGFIEYGGKPVIFDHTHLLKKGLVDLWVLEDGGKWSKKSLVLPPCRMHLVDDINIVDLKVQGTSRYGEVILVPVPTISPYYVLFYDVQKNDLRKVNINTAKSDDGFGGGSYIYFKLMDESESIMHLET